MPRFDEYGQINDMDEEVDEEVNLDEITEGNLDEFPGDFGGEVNIEPNSYENRINQYQTASEELGIGPDLVYEPANGGDTSTSEAFPESDVLYAEIREEAATTINQEGHDVVLADAEELKLSRKPDLVVFRNSAMDVRQALDHNPAEYVFANDWLGNASDIAEHENYEIVGTVPQNKTYFKDANSLEVGDTPDDLYVFQRVK